MHKYEAAWNEPNKTSWVNSPPKCRARDGLAALIYRHLSRSRLEKEGRGRGPEVTKLESAPKLPQKMKEVC